MSIIDSVPPFSDGTYARDPSGRNAIDRGRGPTLTDLTTFFAAKSMTIHGAVFFRRHIHERAVRVDGDAFGLVADLERVDDLSRSRCR